MRFWTSLCTRGAGFCLKSAGRFVLWGAWLLLATTLAVETWIACSHELKLPLPAVRMAERFLSRDGFSVRLGAVSFEPGGRLLVRDFEIRLDCFDEPVLRGALLHTKLDPWGLLAGSPEANQLELSGVELLFPSALSPNGMPEAFVSDLDALVQHRGRELVIHRLTAHCGKISVLSSGSVLLASQGPGPSTPAGLNEASAHLITVLKRIAAAYPQLSVLENATLELNLEPSPEHYALVSARLTADRLDLRDRLGLETGPFAVQTTLPVRGQSPVELSVLADTEFIQTKQGSARGLRLLLKGRYTPDFFTLEQGPAEVSIGSLQAPELGVFLQGATASVAAGSLPKIKARVITRTEGNLLDADANADLSNGKASLQFRLQADSSILSVAGRIARHDLSDYTSVDKGTWMEGNAEFGAGWKLIDAKGWVEGDNVVIYHVPVDHVASHVFFDGRQFLADRAFVRVDRSAARGSYWMDIHSLDYRFQLRGQLQPPKIKNWFNEWWGDFWESFEFPKEIPRADIDITGRWRDQSRFHLYVGIEAPRSKVLSVPMDLALARIQLTESTIKVLAFKATREDGSLEGWFTHVHDPATDEWKSIDFDVRGPLRVADYARMLPAANRGLPASVSFQNAAIIRAYGHFDGPKSEAGKGQDVSFFIDSNGAVLVKDYPIDYVALEGRWKGEQITLNSIHGRAGGGNFDAKASIQADPKGPRLKFDGKLTEAKIGELLAHSEKRSAKLKGQPAAQGSNTAERLSGISLDLQLEAEGMLEDPLSFKGTGKAQVTGQELAQVRLLGGLSQLLSFTALRFTTVKADLELDHEKLRLPNVRLTGHNSAIDASGVYDIPTAGLNFNAKVWPFEENRGLLPSTMGLVLSPFSHAFEVKLGGTLGNPTWAFFYNPLRILEKAETGSEAGTPSPPLRSPNGGQR